VAMAITFDDPPLNEVALGRIFLPRPDFLVPHFGAFWDQVRGQFPRVAHAAPIIGLNEHFGDDGAVILPRVWLLSGDSTTLVQLQQNRFHYNWRQTPERKTYVRFPAIRDECVRLWKMFEEFVLQMTGQPLQPMSAELTYINFVGIPDVNSAFEIAEKTLQDSVWSHHSRFLPAPTGFTHNYSFDIPSGIGVLQVSTATAQRKDGANVLKLELTVRGKHSEGVSFEQWSIEAHDFLVAAFKDLTKPEMHAAWKLREG
jgi:uncharacterized protein (TIGR04255 family)